MLKTIAFLISLIVLINCNSFEEHEKIVAKVKRWSQEIGSELLRLSLTMSRKERVTEAFKPLKNHIRKADSYTLLKQIEDDVGHMMDMKYNAVKEIAKYAEFLSYHRKTTPVNYGEDIHYFNAENITRTRWDPETVDKLAQQIRYTECQWFCEQSEITSPILPPEKLKQLFEARSAADQNTNCACTNPTKTYFDIYNTIPLLPHRHYNMRINPNLSVVKINPNVYENDEPVLDGIRWTAPLDLQFKQNLAKDPTLKFQYFASPVGYMRHFPAVKWSTEQYDVTYDPRTRSWYTEAMTSPKDMIILLDRSGSMKGNNRAIIAAHIVNNILDTLNDNDFVNIYTFTNSTEPLVNCFKNTLVQANEENLRLLRESLNIYDLDFVADVAIGFRKAFQLLEEFRKYRKGTHCNQAIMLITEGVDYDIKRHIFNESNWMKGSPVRVFAYQIQADVNDAIQMEWIACNNRGYFVNISLMEETREKVLPYLNVMSRPINFRWKDPQEAIWSYLYIDLADRRYSNWLWRKFEGNRQREVFLDYVKREYFRLHRILTSETHMLHQEAHEFERYKIYHDYDYMTTVSLPVYDRREGRPELAGVAGVDVPIKLFNSLIPHHKLGVNAYAFILTNNGYVLMHPMHRREFENIPKPTFNRVDFVEVEIMNDSNEPRLFHKRIVDLREKIVKGQRGQEQLPVKFTVDDMKRIILMNRQYYFTKIGPFRLGIAMPENYGLMVVNHQIHDASKLKSGLLSTKNWTVHPDWVYYEQNDNDMQPETPERIVYKCLKNNNCKPASTLTTSLLFDANATMWFNEHIPGEEIFVKKHFVDNVFLATHSGLTRWRDFENKFGLEDIKVEEDPYSKPPEPYRGSRTIDEDWYKRTVEENLHRDDNTFIYSVPFEISGYENNTLITSTHTIFVRDTNQTTPIAVVGLQFNHRAMYEIYNNITAMCGKMNCTNDPIGCDTLNCHILDNNAYVVLSDEIEYTGRFIGDVRPDVMSLLVKNKVYSQIRMFDYQAICYKEPLQPRAKRAAAVSSANTARKLLENVVNVLQWAMSLIWLLIDPAAAKKNYQSIKNETLVYERLEVKKTFPTPCDKEMWLFSLNKEFKSTTFTNIKTKFVCKWWYIVERIPNSNLVLLVINHCKDDTTDTYHKSPTPVEIDYKETNLPCYIANYNNFTRESYIKCYNHHPYEDGLNAENATYCGHTWSS